MLFERSLRILRVYLLHLYFKADFKTICGNIPGFTFDIHTGKAVGKFFQIMFILIHKGRNCVKVSSAFLKFKVP